MNATYGGAGWSQNMIANPGADEYDLLAAFDNTIDDVTNANLTAGTAAGGWRIIKTLGHKMVKLHPVHGFAAETTSATVLAVGMPALPAAAQDAGALHLKALARISRLLKDERFRCRLLAAEGAEGLSQVLREEDERV